MVSSKKTRKDIIKAREYLRKIYKMYMKDLKDFEKITNDNYSNLKESFDNKVKKYEKTFYDINVKIDKYLESLQP